MKHITIPSPQWESSLTSIILDLEKLRTKKLGWDVPQYIFFQLKEIFHILETLGSARIEGNNTTLVEYIEHIIENNNNDDNSENESENELANIDEAIDFIEKNTDENTQFSRAFISEIHKIITNNLTPPPSGEGSKYPGELRKHDVSIKKSPHIPPSHIILPEYFEKFIEFINFPHIEQNQLLKIAIAHHRFEYLHPFDNGNGRMGRLLNYALLIKFGFKVKNDRLLNPSSVFYSDRDKYYTMLLLADNLTDNALLDWCEYFLTGLKNEIEKIDSLLDIQYLRSKILLPIMKNALEKKYITEEQYKVLTHLVETKNMCIKAQDLSFMGKHTSKEKSRIIEKLKHENLLIPTRDGGRIYQLQFTKNHLLRSAINVLKNNGFISDFLNNK